jgi:hypothetical protein
MAYECAPYAVLRIASWSLDSLRRLSDNPASRALLESSESAGESYARRYEAAVQAERRILWEETALDERFAKALAVSNPELAARLLGKTPNETRNRRARHLDTTLYRYLARACTRTEPCDLWAGVTLARWGRETRIRHKRPRYSLCPDLRPFQAIASELRRLPRYSRAGTWKLNPTLTRTEDGRFALWKRDGAGSMRSCVLASHRAIELVVEAFEDTPSAPWSELRGIVEQRFGLELQVAEELLSVSVDLGVLIGGLALPLRFRSAWHALWLFAAELEPRERLTWQRAVISMRRLARRLERQMDELTVAELMAGFERFRDLVATLCQGLGVPQVELPRSLLRCDAEAPFDVELSATLKETCLLSLSEYSEFAEAASLFSASAKVHSQALLVDLPLDMNRAVQQARWIGLSWSDEWKSWEDICRYLGDPPALVSAIQQWQRWLDSDGPVVWQSAGGAAPERFPYGSFVCRLSGGTLQVTGHADELAALFSRFTTLFSSPASARPDPLSRWYAALLRQIAAGNRADVVELVAPFERSPNTLACADLGVPFCSLWQASTGEVSLRGARLEHDPKLGMPVLRVKGRTKPVILSSFSFANYTLVDALAERLLLTSARALPLWTFVKDNIPFRRELSSRRHSPAVLLPSGAVVARRRVVITGAELDRLRQKDRIARYRAWLALARERELPPVVALRKGLQSPLTIHRDSPLAVEAAFEGLDESTSHLIVEEVHDEGFVRGEGGERYAAELAVPYVRRPHAWTTQAPVAASQPSAP